ncbi:MAG: tRNA-ribosyltransferase family protein [Planctomycetota bacterium]|jgi:queuine tRNA-ribosyltransferase
MNRTSENGKKEIRVPRGVLRTPAFLPDATRGVVRGVDAADLSQCGVQAVVMNIYHLMQKPGTSTVQALGGLHGMAGWNKPIVTDSGGFQAYSLIRQNPKAGHLDAKGLTFRPSGGSRKIRLTPEKSLQRQFDLGADILFCLDDCTHADAPEADQKASVDRTLDWARQCKETFLRLVENRGMGPDDRPLLFAVIQGGRSKALRERCASELLAMDFDGYGFGGWPLDREGKLLDEILEFTRSLVPPDAPLFALGIGHPANLTRCARMGYSLFDSSLPTRDARRGRLHLFADVASPTDGRSKDMRFSTLYIRDEKHVKSDAPLSADCDCLTCGSVSRGYLHHLYHLHDALYTRLATIHNLRFMTRLTEQLRETM